MIYNSTRLDMGKACEKREMQISFFIRLWTWTEPAAILTIFSCETIKSERKSERK